MDDPTTFWLVVTNLALAGVVLACIAFVFSSALYEVITGIQHRRPSKELEQALRQQSGVNLVEGCH
jgi:hypothetical protein